MSKSIAEITEIIRKFSDDRGWANDDPNQLITSLIIEIGELAEYFQRKSSFPEFGEEEKRKLGYEFVDVIFYLLRIAQKSDVDIEKYFDEKVPKLAIKFPIGQNEKEYFESKSKYRASGKNTLYE